jgi:hypothetical protein
MAITLTAAARSAAANAVVDLVDVATPGNINLMSAADASLCVIDFAATAFGAAADGVAAADCDPVLTGVGLAAAGAGTACTKFQARNGSDAVVWSGTVTITGGGGDVTVDNPNIAENQNVTVTAFSYTQPATV